MKKIYFFILLATIQSAAFAQEILTSGKANTIAPGSELVRLSTHSTVPDFIRFKIENEITQQQVIPYLKKYFKLSSSFGFLLLNTSTDKIGFSHYRYQETLNGIPVEGTMYIVHVKKGKVISMNGMIFPSVSGATTASLSENDALNSALQAMNGSLYRWQVPAEERQIKILSNNKNATWYPKGELMYAPENGNYSADKYALTYRFDVFALKPSSRKYLFVDAQSGKVIYSQQRIEDNNPVTGSAATVYSGVQKIGTDSEGVNRFLLHDTTRGGGVITRNMNHSTTDYIGATEFSDDDNNWNNVNAQLDQYATDGHLGLEKTYDFYKLTYNRNSVDDNGLPLLGYIHYDNSLVNASWDGTEMNFGDGDAGQGITPLTTLDITGHEMTHGVTQFTCNLNYFGESGGLNESFSDCAGEMVERLGKGTNDWFVGAEIGFILRYFANPLLDGASAASYQDANWFVNTDVHYWSGVQNHWFYILAHGDTATNDLGTPYSVAGIGIDDAHAIAYRNQSVYLVPTSQYADARFYAIQAALDLFGACSPQYVSCTNAWNAVGVGSAFVPGVQAGFSANLTTLCSLNDSLYFTNLSNNGKSYVWDFGDGTTSTSVNPAHLYKAQGSYTVTLIADGGVCGRDSIGIDKYVTVALPDAPIASGTFACENTPAILIGLGTGTIEWFTNAVGGEAIGSGSPFLTPPINGTTTFYAENDELASAQSTGEPNNNFGTGSYFANTNSHAILFDAYDNFTLLSVTVYSDLSTYRTIELRDKSGNLIHSLRLLIDTGKQIVTLNYHVPPGKQYSLDLADGTTAQLFRNQSGANYPYTIPGLLSITGNDLGDMPGYYYYFYDWQVQKDPCTSARVPVVVTALPSPKAGFLTADDGNNQFTFTDTTPGTHKSREWFFGDGDTSTLINPVHQYAIANNYLVQLVVCDSSCCDTASQTITLLTGINKTGASFIFSVSPNPFSNSLQINYSGSSAAPVSVELLDIFGRVAVSETQSFASGKKEITLNTSKIASGIYFIRLDSDGVSKALKVIKGE